MPIGKVEQFDLASKKWAAYVRRVDQFMKLNEIKPELHVATLVTLVGQPTYDLMCDLCAPATPETKTYKELIQIVGDHLEPQLCEIAERHFFRHRPQRMGESLSEFLQDLKHLASRCNFGSDLEVNLRDQFVSGLASDDMKSRLYAEPKLNYKRAVELAFALEAAGRHAQASGPGGAATSTRYLDSPAAEPLHLVEARGARRPAGETGASGRGPGARGAGDRQAKPCWRCGRNHRADNCRFRNYTCDVCKEKGHLKVMCKKSADDSLRRGHNYITESDESECDLYNINVCGKDDKPYLIRPTVNGTTLTFELDTGSKLSTINFDCYEKYFKMLPLLQNNVFLRSYTGTLIESIGYIQVNVALGEHSAEKLKLFVIKNGGPPLCGRTWLRQLNIEKININDFLLNNLTDETLIQNLRYDFPTVFAPGLGTCSKKISLTLTDSKPVFVKARSLPLALREPVERELQRLEAEGTIYKVDYSDYGTPIVPVIKKSGDIRICGDYKVTINPKLVREPYPLPRIEELFAALSGGEQYSKIDLTNAYQQLFLEESSRACTAITTHVGTYVYKRTPFGLTCIPEKFQKFMEETLRGLRGITCYLDDIAVTGRTRAEHIENLRALFERLREVGLRIKLEKCSFLQDSITYVGFIINKEGLHADPNKIKAIVSAPAPKDITQLRSFLGLVNYYAKFIPNLSTILYPLHRLLRKNVEWIWNKDCDTAFQDIKNVVLSKNVLVHYDPNLPLVLSVDSSSYGLGSVLSHRYSNGEERPICFASRTLNAAERGYSQLDKEALAIFTGVVKHHQYLYGRHFIIKTDHKPLTFIFGPKGGLPQTAASRLQRYAVRLAAYNFDIEFVKSADNSNVDALSRLPLPNERKNYKEVDSVTYLNYVEDSISISAKEVASRTKQDNVLKKICEYIISGWPSSMGSDLKPYHNRKDCLTIDRGCILYNHRVVIPLSLRKEILNELHEGHLGVVKMKNIARGYVYWPQLDAEIEALCRACAACRQQRDAPPRSLLHPWAHPTRPWQRIHIDFGELQGKHYLVTIDAHTKWIEVQKMGSTAAGATVLKLRELFARFGLPSQVVSDGGPPFSSREFTDFMLKNRILHTITSPYRPAGNGAAENAVKSVKRAMKKALYEGADVDTAIAKFLFQYRNCEHATTGVAPAVAMFGRRLRGRLDAVRPSSERDVEAAQVRAGRLRPGAERSAQPGDHVLARDYRSRAQKWAQATVTARDAPLTYRVRLADGQEWRRHIDQLLPIKRQSMTLSSLQLEPAEVHSYEIDEPSTAISKTTNDHLTGEGGSEDEILIESSENSSSVEFYSEASDNEHDVALTMPASEHLEIQTDCVQIPTELDPSPVRVAERPKRACLFRGKYNK